MYTLDRQDPSQLMARARPRWFFTILSVIAIVCASCNNAAQQLSSSPRGAMQPPHVTEVRRMPLTDSVPPLITPTVPVSPPQNMLSIPTPIVKPIPTTPTSYEAEAPQNTLTDPAHVIGCGGGVCSGGARVGDIGLNAGTVRTLRFNNINKESSGQYTLTIYYLIAGSDQLTLDVSVNGGPAIALNVAATANGDTIGTASITVNLHAGNNTIEFSNPSTPAPDIDRIVV